MSETLSPGIKRYDFPEDLAKKIVKKLNKLKDDDWNNSLVGSFEGSYRSHIRSSLGQSLILIDEELFQNTKKIMIDCVKDYCKEFSMEVQSDEGLNVLRYDNDDKYEFHVDGDWSSYRTLSVLIYLNPNEYSGGETFFKHFNLGIKPKAPSIVLFPSNYPYMHAAQPVTSGRKYVIVSWLNDRPAGTVCHEKHESCPFS